MTVLVVALAVASLSCSDEPAQPTVAVTVLDSETGNPVAEARLIIESTAPEVGEIARGSTDDDGVWTVTLPEPGEYRIANLHLVGDPPCFWDIGTVEFTIANGSLSLDIEGFRVCA
jgi:hypothetical protein